MCYIRDLDMFVSSFCTTPYQAVRDVKNAVDKVLLGAGNIEISRPLGTEFSGSLKGNMNEEQVDVGVLRFPLGVSAPIEAKNFSGRIIMDRYLAPTGTSLYEPPFVKINEPVFAEIEMGHITDFIGRSVK